MPKIYRHKIVFLHQQTDSKQNIKPRGVAHNLYTVLHVHYNAKYSRSRFEWWLHGHKACVLQFVGKNGTEPKTHLYLKTILSLYSGPFKNCLVANWFSVCLFCLVENVRRWLYPIGQRLVDTLSFNGYPEWLDCLQVVVRSNTIKIWCYNKKQKTRKMCYFYSTNAQRHCDDVMWLHRTENDTIMFLEMSAGKADWCALIRCLAHCSSREDGAAAFDWRDLVSFLIQHNI